MGKNARGIIVYALIILAIFGIVYWMTSGNTSTETYTYKEFETDLDAGTIYIDRQMQYQDSLIKLVPVKTRNGKRTIYLCDKLKVHLQKQAEEQAQAFLQKISPVQYGCFEGGKYAEYLMRNDTEHRYYRTCWILRYCREIGGVLLDQASGAKAT